MYIPVPPINEQDEIVRYLKERISKINIVTRNTERQIELLQEYRQTLISAAVIGALDVREEVITL